MHKAEDERWNWNLPSVFLEGEEGEGEEYKEEEKEKSEKQNKSREEGLAYVIPISIKIEILKPIPMFQFMG